MTHLRAICTLTILSAAAGAQDSTDLSGLWSIRSGNTVLAYMNISQSGNEVRIQILSDGQPEKEIYVGTFESDTSITGKMADGKGGWNPMRIAVIDHDHLRQESAVISRMPAAATIPFRENRRLSLLPLPAAPFDLNGEWSTKSGIKVSIRQDGGQVSIAEGQSLIFKGQYAKNPVITGEILDGVSKRWVAKSIDVLGPDHITYNGWVLYRNSAPASHDLACDVQNTNHVKDYYAWKRGEAAAQEKDYQTARCWLGIAADWGFARAQGTLAALLMEGKGGPENDRLAFELASKSAQAGDITGQVQLATMYENGKGTAADHEKARFWEDLAKIKAIMTPGGWAKSISEVIGAFGGMVDFDLKMTPPSCFARDVGGNFNRPCSN